MIDSRLVTWEIHPVEVLSRPPDIRVRVPVWFREWLEWQDDLSILDMLPDLPPQPQGAYLGLQTDDNRRSVSGMIRQFAKLSGGLTEAQLPAALGVSRIVVQRLLACHENKLRLYAATRDRILDALTRYPRLQAQAKVAFEIKKENK